MTRSAARRRVRPCRRCGTLRGHGLPCIDNDKKTLMNPGKRRRPVIRFLAVASIAVLVWAAVAAGWLAETVVPQLDRGLRDYYLSLAVDSKPDDAPGLLHLVFDNEALSRHGLPTRVPLMAIRDMLESARASREAVVVDIDLATRADIEALEALGDYLSGWSRDPSAALLLLAYPLYDVPYHDMPAFRLLDALVRDSPNIRWAGVGTFADDDGVIRSYEYWTCIDREGDGAMSLLPSVAVYAWARHRAAGVTEALRDLESGLPERDGHCNEAGGSRAVPTLFDHPLPRSGIIEYQTSVDALRDGGAGQYAPDGLPRLLTVGYCQLAPSACGAAAGATAIDAAVPGRLVLVSADNDFSRDEHATPVGFLSGSVILGNAARSLINSGPSVPASWILQLSLVLAAVVVIHAVWTLFNASRAWLRTQRRRPRLVKVMHGVLNPAVVQWLAFAAADLMILAYYYFAFPASDWNGLVGASFGATTVAAIAAFSDWWSVDWEDERKEESE